MRFFSRLPLRLLFLVLVTSLFLSYFPAAAKADNTGFLSLINSYRQQNGLGSLTEDQNLTNAACWFAADMGAKNYFPSNHVDSLGRTMSQRLADFGVSTGSRAENIFYTTYGSSASIAFDAWKNSSGHNTNMLGSAFTGIGIGRANYNGKWYWVTDFASGAAVTMTSQCGSAAAPPPQPPPPPAAAKKVTPKPPPPPPPVAVVETPPVETPITTSAATISANFATKSATKSAVVVKVSEPKKPLTLVQGVAATSLILGNIALFAFIVWRLYRHHRFLR